MELGLGFRNVRMIAFVTMMLVSLLWTILLSVEIFVLYDKSGVSQRNFVGVLIGLNALTAVLLPAMLAVAFRPWLDAARLFFLLLAHFGVAALYTTMNASFECPDENPARKQCRSVNLAIAVCNWVIPALLVWYAAFLAVMYWRRKDLQTEPPEKRLSELPMMLPSRRPSMRRPSVTPVAPIRPTINTRLSVPPSHLSPHPSWQPSPLTPRTYTSQAPLHLSPPATLAYDGSDSAYSSPRSSGRLSKPAPPLY